MFSLPPTASIILFKNSTETFLFIELSFISSSISPSKFSSLPGVFKFLFSIYILKVK